MPSRRLVSSLVALFMIEGSAYASSGVEIIGGMRDEPALTLRSGEIVFSAPQPRHLVEKQIVPFTRNLPPGSILVQTRQRKLYYVLPGGQAALYPVGVGREGFTWTGSNRITRKAEWPDWRPPQAMIERELRKGKVIPAFMPGGPDNPLGARALYIGSTQFRIHGTTQPWSIGRAASSGCIRMFNEHVIELYDQVREGALVVVE
jgi:lipoprotein-anchoring transpeptidase ErfK/SrfK